MIVSSLLNSDPLRCPAAICRVVRRPLRCALYQTAGFELAIDELVLSDVRRRARILREASSPSNIPDITLAALLEYTGSALGVLSALRRPSSRWW